MKQAVSQAIAYLAAAQQEEGSFEGLSSPHLRDFTGARRYPTILPTAFILACLRDVSSASQIRRHAASFLLWHRSEQWSWNYWRRDCEQAHEQPYPDDLDDTACVLAALTGQSAALVDGAVLGYLAQLLIANESAPGGPYKTWLVDSTLVSGWDDVDIAVNANIGYCLYLQGVALPGLETYVTEAIETNNLQSSYYVGIVPVLYFIARWYHGPALPALRRLIEQELTNPDYTDHALMLGLLVTAACNAKMPGALTQGAIKQLVALQAEDHWSPEALYLDPSIKGTPYYAGSAALTTAFAVEALTAYQRLIVAERADSSPALPKPSETLTKALAQSTKITQPDLRRLYRLRLDSTAHLAPGRQITDIAGLTAAACQQEVPAGTLAALDLASLHGWLAYTIYDDFLDDEGKAELLSVANMALRLAVQYFYEALPNSTEFHLLVKRTLDEVDGANTWETVHARATIQHGKLHVRHLPDYGDYTQLAGRSLGHMLAPSGVVFALGYSANGPELQHLQQFFHHFLIARQFNDDAHDWEEDLRHGHLTAVVTMVLRSDSSRRRRNLDLDKELPALQRQFWEETIVEVAKLIRKHLRFAHAELRACTFLKDPSAYESWLNALERATREAIKGRDEAQKFMSTYAAS